MDESGLCHRWQRTHGYAPKGQALHGLTYGKRPGRTNVIGAWSTDNQLFATQTYDNTINKQLLLHGSKINCFSTLKKAWLLLWTTLLGIKETILRN